MPGRAFLWTVATLALLGALSSNPTRAGVYTWKDPSVSGYWWDTSMWTPTGAPYAGDTAVFTGGPHAVWLQFSRQLGALDGDLSGVTFTTKVATGAELIFDGVLDIDGGGGFTIRGDNGGSVFLQGYGVSLSGKVTIGSAGAVQSSSRSASEPGWMTVDGQINLTGGLYYSGSCTVGGGAVLQATGYGRIWWQENAGFEGDTGNIYIGGEGSGSVVVQGDRARLDSGPLVLAGSASDGYFNVLTGGTVTTKGSATIEGYKDPDLGTHKDAFANVLGGANVGGTLYPSTWTVQGDLLVGVGGRGSLSVQNLYDGTCGGQLYTGTASTPVMARIGVSGDGIGEVLIAGNTSKWTHYGEMRVGDAAPGSLTVRDRAQVAINFGNVGDLTIFGDRENGVGTLTVSQYARITANTPVTVGYLGTGNLVVESGGTVTFSNGGSLGETETGVGTAIVTGVSSSLNMRGAQTRIGNGGRGSVTLSDSGILRTDWTVVGAGGLGEVTLLGPSAWGCYGPLTVGDKAGEGHVRVLDNAQLYTYGQVTISAPGEGYTNIGQVLVACSGVPWDWDTRWENTGGLSIGGGAKGVLDIKRATYWADNGAATTVVGPQYGNGEVNIDDYGYWWNRGNVTFGGQAKGTLNLTQGSWAEFGQTVTLGEEEAGTGVMNISGTDSTVLAWGELNIGKRGVGQSAITVQNGGTLYTEWDTLLGDKPGSYGEVVVKGQGSSWFNRWSEWSGDWNKDIFTAIGFEGGAVVSIEDGGILESEAALLVLGSTDTAYGVLNILGNNPADTWATHVRHTGDLTIGYYGYGVANIDCATFSSGRIDTRTVVGSEEGSVAGVFLDNGGRWLASGSAVLGASGMGVLEAMGEVRRNSASVQCSVTTRLPKPM